jgi:hypothetical protein
MNLKRFSIGYETCKNFELPPDTSRIPEIRRIVFFFHLFVVDFSVVNFGFLHLLFCRSKFKAASGAAVGYPHIIRPRSINGLADQGAAALTDGQYIERLQLALQQASISSLQERLAERKVQSVVQLSVKLGKSYYSKLIHLI